MSKKSTTFAENYEEPTALAYTDFTKPMPILEGEDAERFIRAMEENERKAVERAKQPMNIEEAKRLLSTMKMIYEFEKGELEKKEKEIKELEEFIKNN